MKKEKGVTWTKWTKKMKLRDKKLEEFYNKNIYISSPRGTGRWIKIPNFKSMNLEELKEWINSKNLTQSNLIEITKNKKERDEK